LLLPWWTRQEALWAEGRNRRVNRAQQHPKNRETPSVTTGPNFIADEFGCDEVTTGEYFLTGLTGCAVNLLERVAKESDVPLRSLDVQAEGTYKRNSGEETRTLFHEVKMQFQFLGVSDDQRLHYSRQIRLPQVWARPVNSVCSIHEP
jgi:hypothetical protein